MRYANEVPFYLGSLGMRQYECIAYTTRPLSISLPGISVTGHLKASSLMGEGGGGREGAASAGAAGRFIRVASVGRHRSIIGVDLMMFQCRHGSAPGFGGFVFGSNLVGVFK